LFTYYDGEYGPENIDVRVDGYVIEENLEVEITLNADPDNSSAYTTDGGSGEWMGSDRTKYGVFNVTVKDSMNNPITWLTDADFGWSQTGNPEVKLTEWTSNPDWNYSNFTHIGSGVYTWTMEFTGWNPVDMGIDIYVNDLMVEENTPLVMTHLAV